MKNTLTLILAITLAFNPVWAFATPSPSALPESTVAIEKKLDLLNALRATVDRRQFDIEALVDGLDWDAETIVAFVREKVDFEQYPGLLRGPLGTLLSRAGNSLDQAVLLANLLKDAGLDARIARGQLTQAQARVLLGQMDRERSTEPPPADSDEWRTISSDLGDARLADPLDSVPPTPEELDLARATNDLLTEVLERQPVRTMQVDLVEEARDYFWVEFRDAVSDPWRAEHPALRSDAAFPAPTPSEYFSDTIPSELQHSIRLAVFIERAELGTLKTHEVVPAWERPSANLVGRSFALLNLPNGLAGDLSGVDAAESLASSELFIPVLNGDLLPGTRGFNLDGVLYDLEARGGNLAASALFESVGEKVDKATAALGALGSSEESADQARFLTAQWIDYTIIFPDGSEQTHRRYLLDRIGPDARARSDLSEFSYERAQPWQLLTSDEFMVAVGGVPQALTLDEQLNDRVAAVEMRKQLSTEGRLDYEKLTTRSRGPDAAVLMAMLRSLNAGLQGLDTAHTYRAAPALIGLNWHLSAPDVLSVSTDMIGNRHRSTNWQDPSAARRDVQMRGIWETVAERRVLAQFSSLAGPIRTPFTLIEDAHGSGSSLTVIKPSTVSSLDRLVIPADQRSLLAGHLAQGASIVLLPDQDPARFAWWRVDPVDGSAIGFLSSGRAATATEALFIVAFGLILVASVHAHGGGVRNLFHCAKMQIQGKLSSNETIATQEQPTWDECMAGGAE